MATLQVRSMDDRLYQALGARATRENRSISQEVIAIVKDHLAHPGGKNLAITEQYLQICGSWHDDRPEEEIAADIRDSRRPCRRRFQDVL